MSDAYALRAHNARVAYQNLAGGHIARRVEALRVAGFGSHHTQGAIQAYQTAEMTALAELNQLHAAGKLTPATGQPIEARRVEALAQFDKLCDELHAMPWGHKQAMALGHPAPLTSDQMIAAAAKQNAENKAREQAKADAEQAIVDAISHAIDAVTEAGGWLTIVGGTKPAMFSNHPPIPIKGVHIVGIADVSTLPADVRQTILIHSERLADEVLRRQQAALAAPVVAVTEMV
jgi:hypothetical protein